MKKILVLGANGMAGLMIYDYLSKQPYNDVYGTIKKYTTEDKIFTLNALNDSALRNIINTVQPDIVINCIGMLIEDSKNNQTEAAYINGFFPHRLALLSKQYKFKLIHLSTDCVFDGEKGNYNISDTYNAKTWYGITKACGEIFSDDVNILTIRTSIIGREVKRKTGLLEWFLSQKEKCYGYTNHIWSGVTTLELAKQINYLINLDCWYSEDNNYIKHLASIPISKYDLLMIINYNYREQPINIIPTVHNKKINKCLKKSDIFMQVPCHKIMIQKLKNYEVG